tara:strand:- start:42684 stop:43364 length:681 start_codon:yes stop_codon:yes gene_type:complete
MEEGSLRPTIKTSSLAGTIQLLDLEAASDPGEKNTDNLCDPAIFPFLYVVSGSVESSLVEADVTYEMLDSDNFTEALGYTVTIVEDFDSCQYRLVSIKSPDQKEVLDISELIVTTKQAGKFAWDWHPERAVISREERDRFEREHGIRLVGEAVRVPEYSTVYMDIMHETIAKFFEPRRSRDPSKYEVKAWIAGRLASEGMDASDRIAGAMFTIIKPKDHNPKKKRG